MPTSLERPEKSSAVPAVPGAGSAWISPGKLGHECDPARTFVGLELFPGERMERFVEALGSDLGPQGHEGVRLDEAVRVLLTDNGTFENGRMRNEDQLGSAKITLADAERMKRAGLRFLAAVAVLAGIAVAAPPQSPEEARAALIARAKSLELDTPYVPPPGEAIDHHAAGFAKVMCSAVFITGLEPDFAAENVGYFTAPYA